MDKNTQEIILKLFREQQSLLKKKLNNDIIENKRPQGIKVLELEQHSNKLNLNNPVDDTQTNELITYENLDSVNSIKSQSVDHFFTVAFDKELNHKTEKILSLKDRVIFYTNNLKETTKNNPIALPGGFYVLDENNQLIDRSTEFHAAREKALKDVQVNVIEYFRKREDDFIQLEKIARVFKIKEYLELDYVTLTKEYEIFLKNYGVTENLDLIIEHLINLKRIYIIMKYFENMPPDTANLEYLNKLDDPIRKSTILIITVIIMSFFSVIDVSIINPIEYLSDTINYSLNNEQLRFNLGNKKRLYSFWQKIFPFLR